MRNTRTNAENEVINKQILVLWRAGDTNVEIAKKLSVQRDTVCGRKHRMGCTDDRTMSEEARLKLAAERKEADAIRNRVYSKAENKLVRSTRTRYDGSARPDEPKKPLRYPVISAAQAIGRPLITQHWT